MLGLSTKEKLFKAFQRLCDEKLPIFGETLMDKRSKNYQDNIDQNFMFAVEQYSKSIIDTISVGMRQNILIRVDLAFQSPAIAGLPNNVDTASIIDSGRLVGFYYALFYYGITNNKISKNDYEKNVLPLNRYQLDLVMSAIEGLSPEKAQEFPACDEEEIQFIMNGREDGFLDRNTATVVYGAMLACEQAGKSDLIIKILPDLRNKLIQEYDPVGAVARYSYILGSFQGRNLLTKDQVDHLNAEMIILISQGFFEKHSSAQKNSCSDIPDAIPLKSSVVNAKAARKKIPIDTSSLYEALSNFYYNDDELKAEYYYILEENAPSLGLLDNKNDIDFREYYEFNLTKVLMNGNPVEVYGEQAKTCGISAKNRYICFDNTFVLGGDMCIRAYDNNDFLYHYDHKAFNPITNSERKSIAVDDFELIFETPIEYNIACILMNWSDETILTGKAPTNQLDMEPFFLSATDTWKHNISLDDRSEIFSISSISYCELDDYNYKPSSLSGSGKLTFFISMCEEWDNYETADLKGIEYHKLLPLNALLHCRKQDGMYPQIGFISDHGGPVECGVLRIIQEVSQRNSLTDVFCSGGDQFFFLKGASAAYILGDKKTYTLAVTRYSDGWGGVKFQLLNEHDYYLLGAWLTVAIAYYYDYNGKWTAGHYIQNYWPWFANFGYDWSWGYKEKSDMNIESRKPTLPLQIRALKESITAHLERIREDEDIQRRAFYRQMRETHGDDINIEVDPDLPMSHLLSTASLELINEVKQKNYEITQKECMFIISSLGDEDDETYIKEFPLHLGGNTTPKEMLAEVLNKVIFYDNNYSEDNNSGQSLAVETLYYFCYLIWGFLVQEGYTDWQITQFNEIQSSLIKIINQKDKLFSDSPFSA